MNQLSDLDLLAIWERGAAQHALDRALTALGVATARSRAELAELAIGRRDAELLELYRTSFGDQIRATASCPACAAPVELALPIEQLRSSGEAADEIAVEHDGVVAVCRQPTSRDLARAARAASAEDARGGLVSASIVRATRDGQPIDHAGLSAALLAQVEQALADMTPPAEIVLRIACPACGRAWSAPLDLAEIVWRAIDGAARRVMETIAALGERYGWTEADSLALPSARRRYYLERARS